METFLALFFFLRVALAIWDLRCFYTECRLAFFYSAQNEENVVYIHSGFFFFETGFHVALVGLELTMQLG